MDHRAEFNLEWRLITQASRMAEVFREIIDAGRFGRLSDVIELCRNYAQCAVDGWDELYEAVLGDGGIWEFGELYDNFSRDERLFWRLETCILMCVCRIACESEQDYCPQDMEMRSENIPLFAEHLEKSFHGQADSADCIEFFNANLCC